MRSVQQSTYCRRSVVISGRPIGYRRLVWHEREISRMTGG